AKSNKLLCYRLVTLKSGIDSHGYKKTSIIFNHNCFYVIHIIHLHITIAIWKDARRIKIGYLMASADRDKNLEKEEKEEKKDQDLVITDKTIFVTQEKSEFCKNCGIRIDSKSVKCQKCGHSHTAD
ncbi:unnamed protein product, partial [marine sediment metagenome]